MAEGPNVGDGFTKGAPRKITILDCAIAAGVAVLGFTYLFAHRSVLEALGIPSKIGQPLWVGLGLFLMYLLLRRVTRRNAGSEIDPEKSNPAGGQD